MRIKLFSIDSKRKYIFQWIVILLIVLIVGYSITLISTYFSNKGMAHIAQYDMNTYVETGSFNPNVIINRANNLVYNQNGVLIDSCLQNGLPRNWDHYMQKITSKVKDSDVYYSVKFAPSWNHPVTIVTAYSLEDGGIFVFFREPISVKKTLTTITITSILLTFFIATYIYMLLRMTQKNAKMQREYIDNITHELKSPLASFRALTTAMYDGLVKDENKQKHYYSIMLNEVNNLERTVSDMLELSRIQNKQIDCAKAAYSGTELFGTVVEKRKLLCEDLNIELRISPQLEEYPSMYTNKKLASRVLDILLDNAIKFTPVDGFVHLYMTYTNHTVTITVKDSGPGIPMEDKPHIFERFYKADKAHNEKGSGLGLAIAKEIAESLDEKLWLATTRPEGAEFSFTIQKY